MRERLETLLRAHPERVDLALALAQLCLREKDYRNALEYAQQAIAGNSRYSAALLAAGQAAQAMGDVVAARNWFERGLEVAASQGDKQIERQISVFLRRMEASEK